MHFDVFNSFPSFVSIIQLPFHIFLSCLYQQVFVEEQPENLSAIDNS